MLKLVPFISLLALTGTCFAEDLLNVGDFTSALHGRFYTDQYLYTRSASTAPSSLEQSSFSAWFEFTAHDGDFGAHAVEQMDYLVRSQTHPLTPDFEQNLREAYLSWSAAGQDLKIGQQIIPWGKSDGVNPTDYFTAKNLTLMNPDEEVKRFGAPGIHYSYTPNSGNSPINIEAVVLAYYPQVKLLIPDAVLPMGISLQKYPEAPAPFTASTMDYGLKFSYLRSNYDFSVSAFRGGMQYPEYILNRYNLQIYPINPKETAFGADGSFTWDSYIVRLETALHLPDNGSNTDPLFGFVEPDHWDTVVGVERPFFTDFRIQVQALYRYHLYYRAPVFNSPNPQLNFVMAQIGQANALLLNYQEQSNPGATFRISWNKEDSNWSADFLMLGWFGSGQDYLLRPQVGYTPITNLKLQAGMDYYGGAPNTTLGALKTLSDAFFEAKYVF